LEVEMKKKNKRGKKAKPRKRKILNAKCNLPGYDFQERHNIKFINRIFIGLECNACRATWTVKADEKGNMPESYWLCQNGCNKETV